MNKEQERILKELMHKPAITFNKLWKKNGTSNKFAYHLNSLEKDELVEKTAKGYSLTHEGKKTVTYLDGKTGAAEKFPILGVIIIVLNKEGKFLMLKRTKEPFYGYWGFIGGKINFSQNILECAQTELKEESGLKCDLELKGLFSFKTFNNKKLSYNHQMFVIKATNPTGKLRKKTREGETGWFSEKEIENLKTFPNKLYSIEIMKGKRFTWIEADRIQENDEFKEIRILKNIKY